jgi:hypothetical protein
VKLGLVKREPGVAGLTVLTVASDRRSSPKSSGSLRSTKPERRVASDSVRADMTFGHAA